MSNLTLAFKTKIPAYRLQKSHLKVLFGLKHLISSILPWNLLRYIHWWVFNAEFSATFMFPLGKDRTDVLLYDSLILSMWKLSYNVHMLYLLMQRFVYLNLSPNFSTTHWQMLPITYLACVILDFGKGKTCLMQPQSSMQKVTWIYNRIIGYGQIRTALERPWDTLTGSVLMDAFAKWQECSKKVPPFFKLLF